MNSTEEQEFLRWAETHPIGWRAMLLCLLPLVVLFWIVVYPLSVLSGGIDLANIRTVVLYRSAVLAWSSPRELCEEKGSA